MISGVDCCPYSGTSSTAKQNDQSREERPIYIKTEPFISVHMSGSDWFAARTKGDGSCSLHSLWGVPSSRDCGYELFCDFARGKLLSILPHTWDAMHSIHAGHKVQRSF